MSVRTRRTAAVTAGLSLTAALTLALPGSASAGAAATVLGTSSFVDSVGFCHIVGEVKDTGGTNLDTPQLVFTFSSGVQDYALGLVDRLAPGEVAPFHGIFDQPDCTGYGVQVSASSIADAPNHNFTAAITSEYLDSGGDKHVAGTIRNDNTTPADGVQAVFTFYDASGKPVDADYTTVTPGTLAPGETGTFDASGFTGPGYATVHVLGQSTSPAAPAVQSSPTPSPTASTPGSGTASETTPTLSVSPAVISAGQQVTVTYHGTPGATLEIWSKTQPATAYSQIRTVTLDASGVGTSTHTPRRNTRIMAKTAGGLTSTQPLISVRSIASFNAKRVGTRTYTFSGSVMPALNNRLVNLYRNGTLVAQARTNASGVYAVTKTLAKGTFGFQAKTPNDTYNLGAASAVRSLTIS